MSDPVPSARLEAMLMQKRTPTKATLVEAVLVQVLTTEEKIQRIEMIDLLPEETPAVAVARPNPAPRGALLRTPRAPTASAPGGSVDAPAEAPDPATLERRQVALTRSRLRRPATSSSWWNWLLGDYHRVLQFGFETGTVVRGWLPYTVRLSDDARVFLLQSLTGQVVPPIRQGLGPLLAGAWSVLPKAEYNLLAALKPLVDDLLASPRPVEGRSYKLWLPFLEAVLGSFLVFRTTDGLTPRVLQAWSQACLKGGFADSLRTAGTESLRTLLEARSDQLSLPVVLQALATLKSRRVVELNELLESQVGPVFSRDSFDVTPEVQSQIDVAIAGQLSRLETLEKESLEHTRLQYFLPVGDLLERFCAHRDTDSSIDWAVRFLDGVHAHFGPLLSGSVRLVGVGEAVLFRNSALTSSLERLETLKHQLLDPAQARQTGPLDNTAKVLMSLGKTLVVVIRNRSRLADPLVRSADPDGLTDPLPHEDVRLEAPLEWAGLSVIEAVVRTAQVSLLAARMLGDTTLDAALERGTEFRRQAREVLARINHLAVKTKVDEVKDRFSALLASEDAD